MLRAMPADRFHLQIHSETRQEKSFKLEVAKGGIRIKEVDAPVPPARSAPVGAAMSDDGGHMGCSAAFSSGLRLRRRGIAPLEPGGSVWPASHEHDQSGANWIVDHVEPPTGN